MMVLVALGGGLGACLRYAVDAWIRARWPAEFPCATFVINVTGSFVLGLCVAGLSGGALLGLLGTGMMGGYTTFSTASVEAVTQGSVRRGTIYALSTLVVAVFAAWLGLVIGG